jgi:hypothetical protein
MKTKLSSTFSFLLLANLFAAQTEILDKFPKYQIPYIGGYEKYYKDFHDIIVEKKLQPCNNKNEIYQFRILIQPNSSIQFIKDSNSKVVEANKCAYDLAREVAKYQKGWNPATKDGLKTSAIAWFIIYPDDFFNNYKEGYYPAFTSPVYNDYKDDHLEHFRKDITSKIDLRGFRWDNVFVVETEFIITKEGKMKDILITKSSTSEEFDKRIIMGLKDIRKKWSPAKINGNPIDFRFKFTLRAITDPVD